MTEYEKKEICLIESAWGNNGTGNQFRSDIQFLIRVIRDQTAEITQLNLAVQHMREAMEKGHDNSR